MLGVKKYRPVFEGSKDLLEKIGMALLKAFEARSEKLTINLAPPVVKNRLMLYKLLKALTNTRPGYFGGEVEIINRAFELFGNKELADKITARFYLINGNEIAVDITKTADGRKHRVAGFIVDSPRPNRIGDTNNNTSRSGLAEMMGKAHLLYKLHYPEK